MSDQVHQYLGQALPEKDLMYTFADLLRSRSRDESLYLQYFHRGKSLSLSFKEYAEKVSGLIKARPEIFNLPAGSAVMVKNGNTPEAYVAYGALMAQGLTVVPVDPDEALPYVETVKTHAEIKFIIDHETFSLQDIGPDSNHQWRGGVAKSFFFTSGTTGNPKAVCQNFSALRSNLEGTKLAGEMSVNETLFSCLPLFHVNAFNFSFLLPLYIGCPIIYSNGFPLNFWKLIRDEGATIASLSPPIIRLLNQDLREFSGAGNLRYVISASSALYREDLKTFLSKFNVRINQAYGLSETVNFTLFTPPGLSQEEYDEVMFSEVVPSAGMEVSGNEVFILDENDHVISEPGVTGEVAVTGWNVLEEYFKNPSANQEAFRHGYFHTGDSGYFSIKSGKKFFYLAGRLKECVKRNGKLIYLSEIDGAIKSLGMTEACAVGFPHDTSEEEIGLYLVRSSELPSNDEILKQLRSILSFAKCPKVIVEGDKIPKTAVGKVQRKKLQSEFAAFKGRKFNDK